MRSRAVGRLWLVLSSTLIVAATLLPFSALRSGRLPPAWCVACGGLWLTDAISNCVLFAPLGIALTLCNVRWPRTVAIAFASSCIVETMQYLGLPPSRSAALADVIANTFGGLAGVWLVAAAQQVIPKSARTAATLSLTWAALASLVCTLTAVALGPRSGATDSGRYERSPYRRTPNFGWYGGQIDSASVDGFVTAHVGGGPVVVQTPLEPRAVALSVRLRGRDPDRATVPMVFVHRPGDSSAVVFLAQHDGAAELVATRRAWDWGLAMPLLRLPGVFDGRTATERRVLRVWGRSAPDRLELRAESDDAGRSATLWLSPSLGWSLIQNLISVSSPFASLARWSWLALLVCPLAGGGAQAGKLRVTVLVSSAMMLSGTLLALPTLTSVARLNSADWTTMVLLFGIAAAISRGTTRRPNSKEIALRRPVGSD